MEGEGVMEGKACLTKLSGLSSARCLCNKHRMCNMRMCIMPVGP